jgi:hypothetical protein
MAEERDHDAQLSFLAPAEIARIIIEHFRELEGAAELFNLVLEGGWLDSSDIAEKMEVFSD